MNIASFFDVNMHPLIKLAKNHKSGDIFQETYRINQEYHQPLPGDHLFWDELNLDFLEQVVY